MKQLNPLTGLRGVAAYAVLFAHAISIAFLYSGVNHYQLFAYRLAYFGMSLFFILSGFVIHYNYAKLITSAGLFAGGYQFLVARFARLFPLYALVLVCSLDHIPSHIFHNKNLIAISYATMTQSWFDFEMIFFPPAWSISTEWFFYLVFLLVVVPFDRLKRPVLALLIFLPAIFFLLPYLFSLVKTSDDRWATYFSPYIRVFEFFAGMLASKIYLAQQNKPRDSYFLVHAGLLFCITWPLVVLIFNPIHGKDSALLANFMFAPAIAPLLVLACRFDTWISRFLSSRPLLFVGEISYSIYLLQFLINDALANSFVSKEENTMAYINSGLKIAISIFLTTLIAYGSYVLFEKPCRHALRKILTFRFRQEKENFIPATAVTEKV